SQARSAAALSLSATLCLTVSIGLSESVARVGHGKGTVLLRGDLDPIGFAVMGGRGRRIRSRRGSGDRGDGHAGRLVVGGIGNEHSRHRVLLPAQGGEMNLPEIF